MIKKVLISLMCSAMAATWQYSKAQDFSLQTDRPMIGKLSAATLAEPLKKEDGAVDVVKLFDEKVSIGVKQEIATYFSFQDVKRLFEIARSPLFQLDTGKCDKVVFFARLLLQGSQENYAYVLEKRVLSQPHPFSQACWNYLHARAFISHNPHQALITKVADPESNFNGEFDLELLPLFLLPEYINGIKIWPLLRLNFACPLIHEKVTFLGFWGDEGAQSFLADSLLLGWCGFAQDPVKLEEYAKVGWKHAQACVAVGLAEGEYGFAQDPVKLEEYAKAGWMHAQDCVLKGLSEGKYGFTQDPVKLEEYANKGWLHAQGLVAEGLAEGKYGFTKDLAKLEEYAKTGWEEAPIYIAEGLSLGMSDFLPNHKRIVTLSECNLSVPVVEKVLKTFPNKTDRLLYAFHIAGLRLDRQYRLEEKKTNPAFSVQLPHSLHTEGQLAATAFAG